MKSKAFKRYCEEFPYLTNLVEWHSVEATKKTKPEDRVAFVSFRPWEGLDLNDYSHLWLIGDATDSMYGKVAYHVIWKVTDERGYRYGSVSELVHTNSGGVKNVEELRSGNLRNVAGQLRWTTAYIQGPELKFRASIEAVVRIAWTGIHTYRSLLAVEIYRYPAILD